MISGRTRMRLNKYLAHAGVASRRACDRLITEGEVTVDGQTVTKPWFEVDPARHRVTVGGKAIEPPEPPTYLFLNKPQGVLSTVRDPFGRPTVTGLLGEGTRGRRLYPVGRLDADTTGALLLTDDGELAFRLTHPRYETRKVYRVDLDRPVSDADLARIAAGMVLEDGPARPDETRRLGPDRIELVLHEGRKRIVKRLVAAAGYRVRALHRSRFAELTADTLSPGTWRALDPEEVAALQRLVGLEPVG